MNFKIFNYICIFLIALNGASNIIISIQVNDTITLDPCPIPEVEGLVKARRDWYCDNELITQGFLPFVKFHEQNGSLTITARMGDINHVYGCQAFAILENGTEIPGDLLPYSISPIIPAFLENNLKNETVAWGTKYEIPCEAGGVDSMLEIKVNGAKWPRKRVQIFDCTVIECRAFNVAGEETASAHLTVMSDSKEKAHLNLLNDRPSCQPFALSAPSVCSDILKAESPSGSFYAVSTSRLFLAESTNEILSSAFRQWDSLITPGTPSSSPHIRCLQQAKRLVCLLVFPRCLDIGAYVEDSSSFDVDSDERYLSPFEFPVCQQHCFFISALLCASSFNTSHELAALWNYKSSSIRGDGWQELLAMGGNISPILPVDGCAGLPLMATGYSLDSFNDNLTDHFLDTPHLSCQPLSFDALLTSPTTSNAPQNCYVGRGVDYRGTAAGPPFCLPWVELDYVKVKVPYPLTSLSPSIIPAEALNPLPANHSVCRNPLGLAPKPFCVGPSESGNLTLFECSFLVDCAFANSTPPSNQVLLLQRQQRINMISITATICIFFVLLIFLVLAYILRTCRHEKTRVSTEEECEIRRAHLVVRRTRLREANSCARCLLHCLYAFQDACGGDGGWWVCCCHSCCCVKAHDKVDLTKAHGKPAFEKVPDDEDEEVQRFIEFLRQDHQPERALAVAALTHTDNQPHLMPLEAPTSADSQPASQRSSLRPSVPFPVDTSAALNKHDLSCRGNRLSGPSISTNATHIHVDNAFMLASVGQLMHPKLKQISYPRKLLVEERAIAKSAFGSVILAKAPNFPLNKRLGSTENEIIDSSEVGDEAVSPHVIIKTLNFGATPAAETSFFREAELLIELDHPNIIKILGICVPLQPYSLIYEYMQEGDLSTFLRDAASFFRPVTSDFAVTTVNGSGSSTEIEGPSVSEVNGGPLPASTLLRFALGICEAMIYLGSKFYVHRDLATRNCLVNANLVKLADFSMCRRLPHSHAIDLVDVASEAPLPVRWLPLESILQGHFNVDTDVWSFGVFLWELFTFGRLPYGNVEISEVIKALAENKRPPRPEYCPASVYLLMRKCWSPIRCRRPSFRDIKAALLTNLQLEQL